MSAEREAMERLKPSDFGLSDEESHAFSVGVREGYRAALASYKGVEQRAYARTLSHEIRRANQAEERVAELEALRGRLIACEPRGECPVCGGERDHVDTCEVGVLSRRVAELERESNEHRDGAVHLEEDIEDSEERERVLQEALATAADELIFASRKLGTWGSCYQTSIGEAAQVARKTALAVSPEQLGDSEITRHAEDRS